MNHRPLPYAIHYTRAQAQHLEVKVFSSLSFLVFSFQASNKNAPTVSYSWGFFYGVYFRNEQN